MSVRSIFVTVVGIYLTFAFGSVAWQTGHAPKPAAACGDSGSSHVCDAGVRDVELVVALGEVPFGDIATRQAVDRDLAVAAAGVAGIALGFGLIWLQLSHRVASRNSIAMASVLFVERLLALVYLELVVLCAARLGGGVLAGAPITWDSPRAAVDQALTAFLGFSHIG